MYVYFQPKISVEQEDADIKEMIDEEYKTKDRLDLEISRKNQTNGNPNKRKQIH